MREHIKPSAAVNQIMMLKSSFSGVFCLVEGLDDKLLYAKFIDHAACRLVPAWGRPRVLDALAVLRTHTEAEINKRVVAIVDRDLWGILQEKPDDTHLFVTDCHDVEMMIVASTGFGNFVAEYCTETKIATICASNGYADVRALLIGECSFLGYLRWISARDSLSLTFEGTDYSAFVDMNLGKLDKSKAIFQIRQRSKRHDLTEHELLSKVESVQDSRNDLFSLCNGSDALGYLSIALQRALGANTETAVGMEQVGRSLRLSFSYDDFRATGLYRAIRAWESSNVPYHLLPPVLLDGEKALGAGG